MFARQVEVRDHTVKYIFSIVTCVLLGQTTMNPANAKAVRRQENGQPMVSLFPPTLKILQVTMKTLCYIILNPQ